MKESCRERFSADPVELLHFTRRKVLGRGASPVPASGPAGPESSGGIPRWDYRCGGISRWDRRCGWCGQILALGRLVRWDFTMGRPGWGRGWAWSWAERGRRGSGGVREDCWCCGRKTVLIQVIDAVFDSSEQQSSRTEPYRYRPVRQYPGSPAGRALPVSRIPMDAAVSLVPTR